MEVVKGDDGSGYGYIHSRRFMSEDNLARRLEDLRRERGWSQERLAREMARVGVPLPQSAISKIERTDGQPRRTIGVEEALAFADVFEMPLTDLLLSPDDAADVQMTTDLRDALHFQDRMERVTEEWRSLIRRVVAQMLRSEMWRDRVVMERETALSKLQLEQPPQLKEYHSLQTRFYDQVILDYEAERDTRRSVAAEGEQRP